MVFKTDEKVRSVLEVALIMKVERLTRKEKTEAVDVLVDAFYDYPVMRFVLKDSDASEYKPRLKAIIEFYTEARLAKDRPVLGIRENGLLVAVALVDETSLKPWAQLRQEIVRLKRILGPAAYKRLELYEKLSGKLEPEIPHHFLGMIGVRSHYRGKGYAGLILEEIETRAVQDQNSAGICLSTEDRGNVAFYQRYGYKIIAEIDIEELHSWCMFLEINRD